MYHVLMNLNHILTPLLFKIYFNTPPHLCLTVQSGCLLMVSNYNLYALPSSSMHACCLSDRPHAIQKLIKNTKHNITPYAIIPACCYFFASPELKILSSASCS